MNTFKEWLTSYKKDRIKNVLEDFILRGISQVDIGKSLGVSQSYVSRLVKVGIKDFKDYYYD